MDPQPIEIQCSAKEIPNILLNDLPSRNDWRPLKDLVTWSADGGQVGCVCETLSGRISQAASRAEKVRVIEKIRSIASDEGGETRQINPSDELASEKDPILEDLMHNTESLADLDDLLKDPTIFLEVIVLPCIR